MPSALVTGATGILGREIVTELGKDKQTWPTVYALSRKNKDTYPDNVINKHIDLQSSAQEMAKDLQDVQPDIVFFTAYLAQAEEDKAAEVNGAMLRNFLDALALTGAAKKVKRVILTTGAKQYGVHLGRPKNPMQESDRWLTGSDRPPNFYYVQQDLLKQKAKEQGWDWVVTYPNDVIGVAKGNFMNLTTAIGLYAAVSKELGQKELVWPGSPAFYTMFDSFTYSRLHARFNVWAAMEQSPHVSNQAFNVVNGDSESWQNLWPLVAKKFGLKVPEKMFTSEEEDGKMGEQGGVMQLAENPPLREFAAERGLKDTKAVKQSKVEMKIDLTKWSQREDVKAAWKQLAKREGLDESAFEQATWTFLNFVLGRDYDLVISMSKARKAGWTGYEDSWDALSGCLDELVGEGVLPKFT